MSEKHDPYPAIDRLEAALTFVVTTWMEAERHNVAEPEKLALSVVDDLHEVLVRACMDSCTDSQTRKAARELFRLDKETP